MITDRVNMLCSYHYFARVDLADKLVSKCHVAPRLFLDSGAWSAFTQGSSIDFEAYKTYVRRHLPVLDVYCNLDDMRDPEVTWRNQKSMEAEGLPALPVVHMGEPLDLLSRYLDDGYLYIGLGRMVGRQTGPVARWLIKCFKMAEPYGAVFHGLGMTRWELLKQLPFYSVDSSSWTNGHKFGMLKLFDGDGGWVSCSIGDKPSVLAAGDLIKAHGHNPRHFWDRDQYHRTRACQIAGATWMRAAAWLRATTPPVPLPDRARPVPAIGGPGPHLYLADTDEVNHGFADQGLAIYKHRNRITGQDTTT